jgi:hypothetical protein
VLLAVAEGDTLYSPRLVQQIEKAAFHLQLGTLPDRWVNGMKFSVTLEVFLGSSVDCAMEIPSKMLYTPYFSYV